MWETTGSLSCLTCLLYVHVIYFLFYGKLWSRLALFLKGNAVPDKRPSSHRALVIPLILHFASEALEMLWASRLNPVTMFCFISPFQFFTLADFPAVASVNLWGILKKNYFIFIFYVSNQQSAISNAQLDRTNRI